MAMDDRAVIRRILRSLMDGRLTFKDAVERITNEMTRGHITLFVDATSRGLGRILRARGYTVRFIGDTIKNSEIKKHIGGCVCITRNGDHFKSPEDREHYEYGLISLSPTGDDRVMAKKVIRALMAAQFHKNPTKHISVGPHTPNAGEPRE